MGTSKQYIKGGYCMDYIRFDPKKLNKHRSAKSLYRSISIPSVANAYAQCVQFAQDWFLSKFHKGTFKSVYIEGKYAFNEQRFVDMSSKIVRPKPALSIIPNINMEFNNDNVDMYQYGTDLYQPLGPSKDSFFKDRDNQAYLGMALETLFVGFTYKIKVETRAQQLDLYKYIQLACRVGNTTGEEVDLDFHIPYELMIQMAMDLGYDVDFSDNKEYPKIRELSKFLSYLNSHSTLPFVYKYRGINGKNEFFIRMQRMYVHIRSNDITNDDGEREGHLNNNFGIELSIEIRFPAPKFYAYYSNNEHRLEYIYTAFRQPQGIATCFYTFKGVPIPDTNSRGWQKYLETTYEDDNTDYKDKLLKIDFSELLTQGDLGESIRFCTNQGISPTIFMDFILVNGGEVIIGKLDWDTMVFTSLDPPKSQGTYIGIYVDMEYVNQYVMLASNGSQNRMQKNNHPDSRENQTKK